MTLGPVAKPPAGLRQRARSDGTWRIWWEPSARQRKAGAVPVDLRADNLGWSVGEAKRLTKAADARANGDTAPAQAYRSVLATIIEYRKSRFFTHLAASTREQYNADLKVIEAKWGGEPILSIDAPVMDAWYETLFNAKGIFRSRSILITMGIVMAHAERLGWRPKGSNPCRNLRMEKPKGRRRKGTWEEMEACLQAAKTLDLRGVELALLLVIFSGQRQADILAARPEHFQAVNMLVPGAADPQPVWVWSLTRQKRGNAGTIPMHDEILPALRLARLDAAQGPGTLIWDAVTGNAYDRHLFAKRWQAVRRLAAKTAPTVKDLQWRDLRRTFAGLARLGGASRDDVGETIGNTAATNEELGAVYMSPQLETTARAIAAVKRPERKKG
jgi:integrase